MKAERFSDIVSALNALKEHYYVICAIQNNSHRFSDLLDKINVPEHLVRNRQVLSNMSRNVGMFYDRVEFLVSVSGLFDREDLTDRDILFELRDLDRMLTFRTEDALDMITKGCYQCDLQFYKECGYGDTWDQVQMPDPIVQLFHAINDCMAQSTPGMLIHDTKRDYGQVGIAIYDLSNMYLAFDKRESLDQFLKTGQNKPPNFEIHCTKRGDGDEFIWIKENLTLKKGR